MSRNWIEPQHLDVPPELVEVVGGHPLIAQTLFRRGMRDILTINGFLNARNYSPNSPHDLPDIELAVGLLTEAISTGKRILVWGDFDVDGQTATTLLVSALSRIGAIVEFHIPVRSRETHGISLPVLAEYLTHGIDILLTCDTGISAHQAINFARQNQITVIVTDHHDLPAELPNAQALINPKRLPSNHPLSTLPGVGVAYKLVEALYARFGCDDALPELLDLVALGIVADLACIFGETRYLLQCGLPLLRQMRRMGLKILCELAELNPQNITEEHISFVLAPRLNAIGRLADANQIVEFLTTSDPVRAHTLAYVLDGLNAERKLLSEQVFQGALAQLEIDPSLLDYNVIVMAHPSWPAGVIGITASRLVERFGKPAILFSAPPGESARGSARSLEGINITAAIATQTHIVEGFGGHPMAAGLSINPDNLPDFRRGVSRAIQNLNHASTTEPILTIDGYLPLKDLSLGMAEDMERLAPFGPGNPPIVLASRDLRLTGYTAVGKHGEHLLLTIEDELGYTQQAVWWQGADQSIPEGKFDLAYSVRASTYRGQKDIQIEWIAYRPAIISPNESLSTQPLILINDFRAARDPLVALYKLRQNLTLQIWSEGEDRTSLDAQDRLGLKPCNHLVIWSIPPGLGVLQDAIRVSAPHQITIFGNPTTMDQPDAFLKRLAGLVKFSINQRGGQVNLVQLAAATNQRMETVQLGLKWLQTYGHVTIIAEESGKLFLGESNSPATLPDPLITDQLKALLAESAAYRQYFLTADKDRLINPDIH
jgi:single-stranded-DNA-specific exonuclease